MAKKRENPDERFQRILTNAHQSRILREEMAAAKQRIIAWFEERGFQELYPAIRECRDALGEFTIIGQLAAAIFGGSFKGIEFDGLDAITFEEISEALQYAKEGHGGIRECIKAARRDQRAEGNDPF